MKANIKTLAIIVFVYLIASCSESDQILPELEGESMKKSQPVTVTVPFKASFIGEYTSIEVPPPVGECDDSFVAKVGVDYEGTATHLGKFTGSFDFCAGGSPNPNHPDGAAYGPAMTVMIAANGDELWLSGEGFVNQTQPEDGQPEYVTSWWRDPFEILGGTGRFKDATGGGWTDDYNSSEDPNSHHNWTGTITMVKGQGH